MEVAEIIVVDAVPKVRFELRLTVAEPPRAIEPPPFNWLPAVTVSDALARLALVITEALVSDAIERPPESESEVPCPLVKPKLVRVDDAVVEVASKYGAAMSEAYKPPENEEVADVETVRAEVNVFAPEKVWVPVRSATLFERAASAIDAFGSVIVPAEIERPFEEMRPFVAKIVFAAIPPV